MNFRFHPSMKTTFGKHLYRGKYSVSAIFSLNFPSHHESKPLLSAGFPCPREQKCKTSPYVESVPAALMITIWASYRKLAVCLGQQGACIKPMKYPQKAKTLLHC